MLTAALGEATPSGGGIRRDPSRCGPPSLAEGRPVTSFIQQKRHLCICGSPDYFHFCAFGVWSHPPRKGQAALKEEKRNPGLPGPPELLPGPARL